MAASLRRATALLATATTLALTAVAGTPPTAAQEPVTPTLEVEPTTGLHEGADLRITTGEVWPDGANLPSERGLIDTAFCRAVPDPDLEADCIVGTSRDDVPVWSEFEHRSTGLHPGEREELVFVHRYLPLPSGLHDCRLSPCTVSAVFEDVESERVPLAFAAEWAPYRSPDDFIDRALIGLPRRPIGADERASLVTDLTDGTTTTRELVLRYASEPQVDATVGEAARQYVAFLGRRPETDGLAYWTARLEGGLPADRMARHLGASPEARSTYAGLTPGQVVDRVYGIALGRPAEPDGRSYWIARLQAGLPLWKLVWHVARSPEHHARWADEVLATAIHLGWQAEGPTETAWAMGGAMYAWVGLNGWRREPGLP